MAATVLTKDNFEKEVATGLTLVDMWAEWCGPCKMIGPIVEELAEEMSDKLKVGKLDVDSEPELAGLYGVQSIPTLLLFKDGKLIDRTVGAVPKAVLIDFVSKYTN
jgi:thioredoxin 1